MRRLSIGIAVVVALGGAALADRLDPPSAPRPATDRADGPGGVWVCPVAKAAGALGWVHLVNTARDASQVRITFLPDGRRPVEQSLTLPGLRAATVSTPRAIAKYAAGSIVEYAGGDVTVSRTVTLGAQNTSGVGAASCARPGTAGLIVPQGSTLRAETQIAMLNPGTADALVDIALLVDGEVIEPESLQHRIVPARGRLVVREGDFAFDEPAVAAQIVARSGRVVADGVLLGPRLFEIAPAQSTTDELVALASTARGGAIFSTIAVGDADAVTRGLFLSAAGQTSYEPLANPIPPNTPKVGPPPGQDVPAGAVALAVSSDTAPIALGARWGIAARSGAVETAVSSGVRPARRAVAVIGPPAPSSTLRLLVANPDQQDAIVNVTLLTNTQAAAPAALQNLRVAAGRTTTITFPGLPPNATVGVMLDARGGRVAAVLEALAVPPNAFSGFAVTAVPVASTRSVAVEPDPRQGVPAQ